MYDPQRKRGFLYHKFRNETTKTKKSKKNATTEFQEPEITNLSSDDEQNPLNGNEATNTVGVDESYSQVMLFLKHAVVKEQEELIKSSLLESVDYRSQLIAEDGQAYLDTVKLYISAPKLVSVENFSMHEFFEPKHSWFSFFIKVLYDFEISFREIDANSFTVGWPKVAHKPFADCKTRISMSEFNFMHRSSELDNIMLMFKTFKAQRITFDKSLKSFIVASDTCSDPSKMLTDNRSPYIMAAFSKTDRTKVKYYIHALNKIFCVS